MTLLVFRRLAPFLACEKSINLLDFFWDSVGYPRILQCILRLQSHFRLPHQDLRDKLTKLRAFAIFIEPFLQSLHGPSQILALREERMLLQHLYLVLYQLVLLKVILFSDFLDLVTLAKFGRILSMMLLRHANRLAYEQYVFHIFICWKKRLS